MFVFFVDVSSLQNKKNIPGNKLYEWVSASDLQNAKYTIVNGVGSV